MFVFNSVPVMFLTAIESQKSERLLPILLNSALIHHILLRRFEHSGF